MGAIGSSIQIRKSEAPFPSTSPASTPSAYRRSPAVPEKGAAQIRRNPWSPLSVESASIRRRSSRSVRNSKSMTSSRRAAATLAKRKRSLPGPPDRRSSPSPPAGSHIPSPREPVVPGCSCEVVGTVASEQAVGAAAPLKAIGAGGSDQHIRSIGTSHHVGPVRSAPDGQVRARLDIVQHGRLVVRPPDVDPPGSSACPGRSGGRDHPARAGARPRRRYAFANRSRTRR